jgi:hypothetical protein
MRNEALYHGTGKRINDRKRPKVVMAVLKTDYYTETI